MTESNNQHSIITLFAGELAWKGSKGNRNIHSLAGQTMRTSFKKLREEKDYT